MARYIVMPADIEPTVLVELGRSPSWELLPPEETRKIEVDGETLKETFSPRVEFLDSLGATDQLYAPLGGIGDAFLVGAYQRGAQVYRMTFHDLNRLKETVEIDERLAPPAKIVKGGGRQAEWATSAAIMATLVTQGQLDEFRPFEETDLRIALIRVYINMLIATQDEIRKRLQLRTTRLERDQAYFLDPSASQVALEHRIELVEGKGPVDSLLGYEKELEREITKQLKRLAVFTEVLDPVKGIGPRLAARIIAPVVDIRRFPKIAGFRKYAGWHVMENGRPRAAQFIRGESAQFHELLRQGVWLFGQQLVRSNSQFRRFYDDYKARKAELVGTVMGQTKAGKDLVMTKAWLDARARRFAASKFLNYLWFGWWELHGKQFTSRETSQPFTARDLLEG